MMNCTCTTSSLCVYFSSSQLPSFSFPSLPKSTAESQSMTQKLISFSVQSNSSTSWRRVVVVMGDCRRTDTHSETTTQKAVLSKSQLSDVNYNLINPVEVLQKWCSVGKWLLSLKPSCILDALDFRLEQAICFITNKTQPEFH